MVTGDVDPKDVKVVMLTTFELDEYVFEAIPLRSLRLPGQGHRAGRTPPARGTGRGVGGDALLSPGVTRRLISEFAARSKRSPKRPPVPFTPEKLTEREREVMALVERSASRTTRSPVASSVSPAHREDPRQPHDGQAGRP